MRLRNLLNSEPRFVDYDHRPNDNQRQLLFALNGVAMISKMAGIIFLCLAVLPAAISAGSNQKTITLSDLAGTYVVGFTFGGHELTLKIDGTYGLVTQAEAISTENSGRYTISNGNLYFTILKSTWHTRDGNKTVNLLDPDEVKKEFGTNDGSRPREFSLMPVRWSSRLYLMPQNSLEDFVKNINLGIEPRVNLITRNYYGDFYLREGDEDKEVTGNPDLPKDLLSQWLQPPITGTIVSIYRDNDSYIATIDKGSVDGLVRGTEFVVGNSESFDTSRFPVLAVTQQIAMVKINQDLKVGDKLSTKYGRQVQALLIPAS
jgi:hypothetical protein